MGIRQATMEDYDPICALLDEVDAQHREALPQIFRDPGGVARSRAYIASIVQDENACLWIAEHENEVVGILHVVVRETRDIPILVPRRYAVIEDLVVSAEHRRKGVGRALMRAADRWAKERNIRQVQLHVWEFNHAAQAFYEALGYRTVSRTMWKDLPNRETATGPDSP